MAARPRWTSRLVGVRRGAVRALPSLMLVLAAVVDTSSAEASCPEIRPFNGSCNNLDNPEWGSVGQTHLRYVAGADYADDDYNPPGDGRPSAREVMSEVFLASAGVGSSHSAIFVAWAQLIMIDISLTSDNSSEPFDISCDDGDGLPDVWCPSGAASGPISFNRSEAALGDDGDGSSTRNPINHATSYIDLDYLYGRSEEQALSLRKLEGGYMDISDEGLPFLNEDGTWKIADQRTAKYPVTFALHTVLLREHNRCCDEEAPLHGFYEDDDVYFACRRWTTAVVQHITEEDFSIQLLDGNLFNLVDSDDDDADDSQSDDGSYRRRSRALETVGSDEYDDATNAGVDVFAITAGGAALESALPPVVRVLLEGYEPADDDMIDLHEASNNLASFVQRNGIGPILRGAVLSTSMSVDAHYTPVLSNLSPLFKLPVDGVQRGRDHGVPTYNDVREAYGLSRAASFVDVTTNEEVQLLLEEAYGNDIDLLDAFTGALAEGSGNASNGFMGELFQASWTDQLYRAITGDRYYHNHSIKIEDVKLVVLSAVINRTTNVSDLPTSVFVAPDVSVCTGTCEDSGSEVTLEDGFKIAWKEYDNDTLRITLSAKDIGSEGMLGIGFGGEEMMTAVDYIICEVLDATEAECIDRKPVDSRDVPDPDEDDYESYLRTWLSVGSEWTSVTFERDLTEIDDDQDYDLASDIAASESTAIIYAYREGSGVDQHPNSQRGAYNINFDTGDSSEADDSTGDFYSLHGALILLGWMVVMPVGLYYVRYRKGEEVIFGNQWYEMHAECMVIAAEGMLPMSITAIVATGGSHTSPHAKWGFYMIAAVVAQLVTGWLRVKALEAKQSNFSPLHRLNKYFHIWSGRVAYVLGVIQCYRGLSLVSETDSLVFSALEMSFELGNFGEVNNYVFPVWGSVFVLTFLYLETRKRVRSFKNRGNFSVCGFVEVVNDRYQSPSAREQLIARDEELPLYTMSEFNEKVLNGRSWVMVDGAIIDVGDFAQRHPGGSRLITNALGTDVTHELLGENLSVGHVMSFNPHKHEEKAWSIVRSLVVGYIDDDMPDGSREDDTATSRAIEEVKAVDYGDDGGVVPASFTDKEPTNGHKLATVKLPFSAHINLVAANPMAWRAKGLRSVASLPETPSASFSQLPGRSFASSGGLHASCHPVPAGGEGVAGLNPSVEFNMNLKALLERFHVCPLLLRESMSVKPAARPVFKYVFACPGPASILASSIKGACFFNMRATNGKGVVQRAYNGFAVRVVETSTEGTGPVKAGQIVHKLLPAEAKEGRLCIELRIRHQHDGAMSNILENLAKDSDNPAVQLQGPFLIESVAVPPAHRNVVMIAAGTGINPMIQVIRDYQAAARTGGVDRKSRLVVIWQVTTKTDLFCKEEMTELQVKSHGLLEVTVLISGDHRRRNIPGVAFRRMRARFRNAVSPAISSANTSTQSPSSNRQTAQKPFVSNLKRRWRLGAGQSPTEGRSYDRASPIEGFLGQSRDQEDSAPKASPTAEAKVPVDDSGRDSRGGGDDTAEDTNCASTAPRGAKIGSSLSKALSEAKVDYSREDELLSSEPAGRPGDGVSRRVTSDDPVNRQKAVAILEGEGDEASDASSDLPEVMKGLTRIISFRTISGRRMPPAKLVEEANPRRAPTTISLSWLDEGLVNGKINAEILRTAFGEPLLESLATYAARKSTRVASEIPAPPGVCPDGVDELCGSRDQAGKLQVIVSGPSGFVFQVENLLDDMKVPRAAVVMLD